jgi:hypothetical protein
MADRPIIFSAPMIRALLDGRKTQTRRVVKMKDGLEHYAATGDLVNYYGGRRLGMSFEGTTLVQPIPYAPGDRLWVREGHAFGWPLAPGENLPRNEGPDHAVTYRADGHTPFGGGKWRSPIHMPRWASRLTLVVTDVRVQRLQEITGEDCIAEGVQCETCAASWSVGRSACNQRGCFEIRQNFRHLWNSLHGPDAWDQNQWVVALTFDVHRCNIDQMTEAT